jgi:hypothetical protein
MRSKIFILLFVAISFVKAQGTIGDLPETISPNEGWVMEIESPLASYHTTLTTIYNKFLARNNTWTGVNIYNGLVKFDSTMQQIGNRSFYNNFNSGWGGTGFRLDYGIASTNKSSLEIDNLTVRGIMSVYEMDVKRMSAPGGNLLITSSAKVAFIGAFPFPGVTPDTTLMMFEDPEGTGLSSFKKNDLIRSQRYNPLGSITRTSEGTVDTVYIITDSNGNIYPSCKITYYTGTLAFKIGDSVVRVGSTSDSTRQASIGLMADDINSPLIFLKNHVNSWSAENSGSSIYGLFGNLNGITVPGFGTLSGYGLYCPNGYFRGNIEITNSGEVADSLQILVTNAVTLAALKNNQTLYSTTAPTLRRDGTALRTGDQWINPDSSNLAHVYNVNGWVKTRDLTSDWNYLGNIPHALVPPDTSISGLALSGSYFGFHNHATWKVYIADNGQFYFGGNGTNYVSWNGTSLDVRGHLNADDINTGHINSLVLIADSIKTGYLRSLTLVGGTIKSNSNPATSGGILMSGGAGGADYFNMYDAAGHLTVSLNANTYLSTWGLTLTNNGTIQVTTGISAPRPGITSTTNNAEPAIFGQINSNGTAIIGGTNAPVNLGIGGGNKTGIAGTVSGTGDVNYGVYGSASGATTNWAGYFAGNTYAGGLVLGNPLGDSYISSAATWNAKSDAHFTSAGGATYTDVSGYVDLTINGVTYHCLTK